MLRSFKVSCQNMQQLYSVANNPSWRSVVGMEVGDIPKCDNLYALRLENPKGKYSPYAATTTTTTTSSACNNHNSMQYNRQNKTTTTTTTTTMNMDLILSPPPEMFALDRPNCSLVKSKAYASPLAVDRPLPRSFPHLLLPTTYHPPTHHLLSSSLLFP